MPSVIGLTSTVTFLSLKGPSEPIGFVVGDVSRPGVDGSAYRQEQRRGAPYVVEGVRDCDSLGDANTVYATLKGMQGTLVGVSDDYGEVTAGAGGAPAAMLLDVRRLDERRIAGAVGGVSTLKAAWLRVQLTLQRTE